mgnify:FL=1
MNDIIRTILIFTAAIFAITLLLTDQPNSHHTMAQATPTPPITEDDEPIRIETELVNVLLTAQDSNRRFITNLSKEDIKVFEDGEEQEIFTFSRQTDLPLSIAIIVDTSFSQFSIIDEEKEVAKTFIESVVRPNKDEVAVISFSGEIMLEQELTSNLIRLRRAIDSLKISRPSPMVTFPTTPPISGGSSRLSGSTALWDAIWVASEEVLSRTPERTRRVIIVLTDGRDTSSRKNLNESIKAALIHDITVYSIGIGDDFYGGVEKSGLNKLSNSTGGRSFFPRDESQLRQAFAEIETEMRSQYLIAYQPKNQKRDGSFRRIQIKLVNPQLAKQNIRLIYREGYFAKGNKTDKK